MLEPEQMVYSSPFCEPSWNGWRDERFMLSYENARGGKNSARTRPSDSPKRCSKRKYDLWIVPKSLAFYNAWIHGATSGLNGEQKFDESSHPGMLLQFQALWI